MAMTMLKNPQLDDDDVLDRGGQAPEHDPALLCARLRALALEAHQAARARKPLSVDDFGDLHARITQLRSSLYAQRLDGLADYVSALERTLF